MSDFAGRSLENYKKMHEETARKKDVYNEFMACRTLTKARKILWGEKSKVSNCSGCGHKSNACACGGRRR